MFYFSQKVSLIILFIAFKNLGIITKYVCKIVVF